jgi:hypothetical protein
MKMQKVVHEKTNKYGTVRIGWADANREYWMIDYRKPNNTKKFELICSMPRHVISVKEAMGLYKIHLEGRLRYKKN